MAGAVEEASGMLESAKHLERQDILRARVQNWIRGVSLDAFKQAANAAERTIAPLKAVFDIVTDLDMGKILQLNSILDNREEILMRMKDSLGPSGEERSQRLPLPVCSQFSEKMPLVPFLQAASPVDCMTLPR